MFKKLDEIEMKYIEIEQKMSDPEIIANKEKFRNLSKHFSELSHMVEKYRRYKKAVKAKEDSQALLDNPAEDSEIKELAQQELEVNEVLMEKLEHELKLLLLPKNPNDQKNVILEIRGGTGGDEASLFAGELFRMYTRYAENHRWKTEILSSSPTGVGGFKEIIILISGSEVYSHLKYEGGVHRVQRVPVTEASGRIHTSAVTVAVLPEAEEVDVEIDANDLKIDVYRSSGPGGQSVNTTDSAVRITHLPTGIVISCQDEKSQHKNKSKGLKVLRSRLLKMKEEEQHEKIAAERKAMVSTGDRSAKIRTYNFPQGRVTDHRIGLTLHKLDRILLGDLDELIQNLITHYQTEALKIMAA
ncbi:MAG: peptide chain release factor 1 [Candidatus Schekmanbacteria bacterium RBG_13_48_7]|uniref:Peptide chain release factor 1 n=1 Tax=Candidatus Schekmanbacteria bacterium RBG_13_48_7 TaxID=1817878 RepID=A0A1F7S409_9BACT|nr:MAG: peptide chain release factor 1 [Candidatus Schekmanbacteria bacterium RBG_13_48_7]